MYVYTDSTSYSYTRIIYENAVTHTCYRHTCYRCRHTCYPAMLRTYPPRLPATSPPSPHMLPPYHIHTYPSLEGVPFSWSSIRASTAPSVGEFAAGARARAAAAEFAARRSAKRLEKFMMARRRRQQQQDLQQLLPTAATKGYQVGDTKVDSTNARDMVPYNYISHIYETLNGSHIII